MTAKKPVPEKRASPAKWNEKYLIDAYELARAGKTNPQIAICLELHEYTFQRWVESKPALQNALMRARQAYNSRQVGKSGVKKFHDYMYDRLPGNLRRIWDEIVICNNPDTNDTRRLEALMAKTGRRARQQLFIHAFTTSNFRWLTACRLIGLNPQTVRNWIDNDVDFAELYQHVLACKKDFFEDAFLDLVADGNPMAIMYAVKTHCPGYREKEEHVHSHHHTVVSVDSLNLSVEERKALLEKIRDQRKKGLPDPNVIDVEFTPLEAPPSLDDGFKT